MSKFSCRSTSSRLTTCTPVGISSPVMGHEMSTCGIGSLPVGRVFPRALIKRYRLRRARLRETVKPARIRFRRTGSALGGFPPSVLTDRGTHLSLDLQVRTYRLLLLPECAERPIWWRASSSRCFNMGAMASPHSERDRPTLRQEALAPSVAASPHALDRRRFPQRLLLHRSPMTTMVGRTNERLARHRTHCL